MGERERETAAEREVGSETPPLHTLRVALSSIRYGGTGVVARMAAHLAAGLRWYQENKSVEGLLVGTLKQGVVDVLQSVGADLGTYATQTKIWTTAFRRVPTLVRSRRLHGESGKVRWFVRVVPNGEMTRW